MRLSVRVSVLVGVLALACCLLASGSEAARLQARRLEAAPRSTPPHAPAPPTLPEDAFLFPRLDIQFPTNTLDHVEPVLDYRVVHEDNAHLHSLETQHPDSDHPLKIGNAANSIGAHSLKMRQRHGHKQPFPDTISVHFRAFDLDWSFPQLQLDMHTWVPHTTATITDQFGNQQEHQHSLNTYKTIFTASPVTAAGEASDESAATQGWAVVTLAEDGLMTAVIHTDTDTFQINPLFVHEKEMDTEHPNFAMLKKHARHGMVMFRHADAKHLGTNPETGKPYTTCGVADKNAAANGGETTTTPVAEPHMHGEEEASSAPSDLSSPAGIRVERVATARRLMGYAPGYGLTLWTSCYPSDSTAHKTSVGVVVDYGYYALYGTNANVLNSIANVYASVNAVYLGQFNTFLQIGATDIRTVADSTAWNLAPASVGAKCTTTINDMLTALTNWRSSSKAGNQALWHSFTNCYPSPGTVGLAYVGVVCNSYGTGVSSWTPTHWLVVAHEMGHNFGAGHTFQNGQGTTGGIMDYGDGAYPVGSGIYQFNSQYNKPEICAEIASIVATSGYTPFCWAAYAPTCGNGVIEAGEQCDDTTSCCSNCQLMGQCTTGSASAPNPCCTSTCTYKPTTTTCSNGMGYCANGACQTAVCRTYGLPFCGITTNGCKQICGGPPSTYACSSGWSTPDCNLATGLVCNTSPASTCSAGTCVASPPTSLTYSWVSSQSACSCSGTYTVTVTCRGSDGATYANSNCNAATMPATSGTCTAPSSCFVWVSTAFTACSVDCGTGTQTRSVTCMQGTTQVSATQCVTTAPVTQQTCSPGACPVAWVAGAFGSCTVSCGGGTQGRSVQCMQTQNGAQTVVATTSCTATMPVSQQACNTPACAVGAWVYSAFGTCSKECGSGTQTRTASCVVSGVVTTDLTKCAAAGTAILSQSCNTSPCPTYSWTAGVWGTCSVSCGGGTQTRTAKCFDTTNDPNKLAAVNTNLCTLTQPVTVQACNTDACPIPPSYIWLSGAWGTCSASCGGGLTTRSVTCVDQAHGNAVQTVDKCAGSGTQPVTQQACAQQGCPVYVWSAGGFGACSVACGGGIQNQTVSCIDQSTQAVVAKTLCTAGTAPAATRACGTAACGTHAWKQGSPSTCSAACGGGIQNYSPVCYRTDVTPNTVEPDATCSDQVRPATQSTCNTAACPTYWYAGPLSACSATCGPTGVQTRTVKCYLTTDNVLTATAQLDSACTASKPATSVPCNSNACPTWQVSSAWGNCSAVCGTGIQSRSISCQNWDGTAAVDAACSTSVAPAAQRTCYVQPCTHWHRNLWSDCSKPCADSLGPGYMNRDVICRFPHDDPLYYGIATVDQSTCGNGGEDGAGPVVVVSNTTANGKPATTMVCATDSCPTYYWLQSNPSACSKECGGGTRTATVVCVAATTGAVVANSNCVSTPPESTYACNTGACPQFEWKTGNWSSCSSFCGTGVQTRTVQCRNYVPDLSIHYPWADEELSMCVAALGQAAPASSKSCTQPEAMCWGTEYLRGGRKNGRCETTAGMSCTCRTGWTGTFCDRSQLISNVQTNSLAFGVAGVPLGEPLIITWNSSVSAIPRISVLLERSGSTAWPVAQYLAYGIQNTNVFQWTVGSILQAGLDGGANYAIRIFASTSSNARSALFNIADPCSYMSCGAHGTCASGKCTCVGGYSGTTCTLGPCENAMCDTAHSSCNNSYVVSSGQYLSNNVCSLSASTTQCKGGYTGAQCRTPPLCASQTCANGGDLANVLVTATECTGTCSCRGLWQGSDCTTCPLVCQHGSSPDAGCTKCVGCNAGYFGQSCECKYYNLGFRFNTDISSWWSAGMTTSNSLVYARWVKTLAMDLVGAVGLVSANKAAVSIEDIKPLTTLSASGSAQVDVTVRLSLDCATTAEFGGGAGVNSEWTYADNVHPIQGPSADRMAIITHAELAELFSAAAASGEASRQGRRLLQTSTVSAATTLLLTYTTFLPLLSDMDSAVWQGQVTSTMDPDFTVTASDPSGEQQLIRPSAATDCFQTTCTTSSGASTPESSSSGGLSTLAFGLIIAGIILVLLVIGVGCALFFRHNRTVDASKFQSNGAEREMASVQNSGRWNGGQA